LARILLIEDEKSIADIMTMLLGFGQHEVLLAIDGEAGLTMARRDSPDLILLDIMLPKLDGIALNRELLQDEKTRRIPVIVITTQSARDNTLQSAENVKVYLQKPFDMMILLDTIREVLHSAT